MLHACFETFDFFLFLFKMRAHVCVSARVSVVALRVILYGCVGESSCHGAL